MTTIPQLKIRAYCLVKVGTTVSRRVCAVRGLIEEMLEAELRDGLGRERYVRHKTTPRAAVEKSEGLGDEEAVQVGLLPSSPTG